MSPQRQPGGEEYEFALVLADSVELTGEVEGALFEAGCGDATVGVQGGEFVLMFARADASFEAAVQSAIRDVQRSGVAPGGVRVRRTPDAVAP